MISVLIVCALLCYLPVRVMRSFPRAARVAVFLIVMTKAGLIIGIHVNQMNKTHHPIVIDTSVDAKKYYDVASKFANVSPFHIRRDDLAGARGGSAHLGYYVFNIFGMHAAPSNPMLFIRLTKLLLFHVSLGMLASVWRVRSNSTRAFVGYLMIGVVFYQFFYYTYRNLKDDLIMSIFMAIIAIVDGYLLGSMGSEKPQRPYTKVLSWVAVGVLTWAMASVRFYVALAIVCGLGMHTVTAKGMKPMYRMLIAALGVGGFFVIMATKGGELVAKAGGSSAVLDAAGNIFGIFKIMVTPVPWQHHIPFMIPAHVLYLLLLPVILVSLFMRLRSNLDWKLFATGLILLAVGGHIKDFNARKRYPLYPIFIGWIVTAARKRSAAQDDQEAFDVDAYFARHGTAYT
jgi:hypothetical protein